MIVDKIQLVYFVLIASIILSTKITSNYLSADYVTKYDLCIVDCFSYRINTSEGSGGYCDCGDPEAFLRFPFCATHEATRNHEKNSLDVLEEMPSDVKERAEELIWEVVSN